MATSLVTYDTVKEAADALEADGQRASVRNVRQFLGGGSPNAISLHLNERKAGRPSITDSAYEIPEGFLEAVRELLRGVGEKAGKLSEEKAAALQDDLLLLQEEVTELESDKRGLAVRIDEQTGELAHRDRQISRLGDDLDRVKQAAAENNERLTREKQAERERADVLADRLAKAESQLETLAGVERERDNLKADLEQVRQDLVQSEKAAAIAKAEAHAQIERAEQAERREAKAEAQTSEVRAKLESRIESLEGKLDTARADLSGKDVELATAKERAAGLEATLTKLEQSHEKTRPAKSTKSTTN
jgi:chromosome segregation ATPase